MYCILFRYPFPDSGLWSWNPNLTNVFPVLRKVMIHYSKILAQLSWYINVKRWSNYIHKIWQNFIVFYMDLNFVYGLVNWPPGMCSLNLTLWMCDICVLFWLIIKHTQINQWYHIIPESLVVLYICQQISSCWQPQYFLQLQNGSKICALKICGLILKSCWAYSWWAMLSVVIHPTTCVSSKSIELSCSCPY